MTIKRPAFYLTGIVIVAAAIGYVVVDATRTSQLETTLALTCDTLEVGATRVIPAGKYVMGSEKFYVEETPLTGVTLESFDIDAHEVTNAQFRQFVESTDYVTSTERATEIGFPTNGGAVLTSVGWSFVEGANWRHPTGPESNIEGRDHYPVVQVSFEDAVAYAEWAGRELPTEAQWEYAARGNLKQAEYAWGNQLTPDGQHLANTWQGAFPIVDTADDGYKGLAPIGCFAANGYGLYDMIGNTWEWTADSYYPNHQFEGDRLFSDAGEEVGFNPSEPGVPAGVIKGGSFLCAESYCKRYRPSARQPQDQLMGTNHIGFRTVSKSN